MASLRLLLYPLAAAITLVDAIGRDTSGDIDIAVCDQANLGENTCPVGGGYYTRRGIVLGALLTQRWLVPGDAFSQA